jgi:outer membrane protein OmpA-like peptidoglycan-associated protein
MHFVHTFRLRGAPAALALAAAALTGCSVPVVAPPTVPPPVSAAPSAAAPVAAPTTTTGAWNWSAQMDQAASKLRSALRGSSAEVSQTTDQRLWISLPVEDVFAAGRSALKPPAGAWLDQVALALREVPAAEVQIVGQPDAKGAGGSALAVDRASSARDWMVMRGVAARRVAVSGAAPSRAAVNGSQRLEILIGQRSAAVPR